MRICGFVACVALGAFGCGGLKTSTTTPGDAAVSGTGTDAAVSPIDAGTDAAAQPNDAGQASDLSNVTPTGKLVYVGGGQDVRIAVSFDGKTFGSDTYVAPTGLDNAFGAIVMGNGIVVGAADSGIYVSSDAQAWTIVPKPTNVSSLHGAAGAFGNGKFVFVSNSASYVSTDGKTWTVTNDMAQSAGHWHQMAYGNGHFVAIGDSVRKVSEDGLTWHDFAATPLDLASIGFGNGIFVVTAADTSHTSAEGYSATSTDGVTWTTPTNTATSYSTGFAGVAYGAGHWVTGDCCNAFTSSDGKTWTKAGAAFGAGALRWSGEAFVGIGWRTNIFISSDGTGFTKIFSDDGIDKYNPDMQAPWLTTIGAGYIK